MGEGGIEGGQFGQNGGGEMIQGVGQSYALDSWMLKIWQCLLEAALELYLDDQCSLGRAAELARVTRWELIDVLKTRNIAIPVYSRHSARQIDELAERLEQVGVL